VSRFNRIEKLAGRDIYTAYRQNLKKNILAKKRSGTLVPGRFLDGFSVLLHSIPFWGRSMLYLT
jgi:hypothetical protein